jgi:alkylhydroperoxidase family enzyme
MARLTDVPDEELAPELAQLAQAQHKAYGTLLNSTRQAAYTPPIAAAASAMGRAIVRSGRIAPRLASLVNLRVSAIVGCPF